jgi:hypothetical protein
MQVKIRWPSEVALVSETKLGDLFAWQNPRSTLLMLRVEDSHAEEVVLLAEFGGACGLPVPSIQSPEMLFRQDDHVRRICDGLVVEPLEIAAAPMLAIRDGAGAVSAMLAEMNHGKLGLYVHRAGAPAAVYDLNSGNVLERRAVRELRHWRLFWIDGTDKIELLSI